jgi:hypothetical protein
MSELEKLLTFVPEQYRPWVLLLIFASPYITRSIYSIMQGGGIVGIAKAIWLGTNVPKQRAVDNAPVVAGEPNKP